MVKLQYDFAHRRRRIPSHGAAQRHDHDDDRRGRQRQRSLVLRCVSVCLSKNLVYQLCLASLSFAKSPRIRSSTRNFACRFSPICSNRDKGFSLKLLKLAFTRVSVSPLPTSSKASPSQSPFLIAKVFPKEKKLASFLKSKHTFLAIISASKVCGADSSSECANLMRSHEFELVYVHYSAGTTTEKELPILRRNFLHFIPPQRVSHKIIYFNPMPVVITNTLL